MTAIEILKNVQSVGAFDKDIDEAITELQQLKVDYSKINDAWIDCVERYESVVNRQIIQEHKTCDGCRYEDGIIQLKPFSLLPDYCKSCARVASDRWESKND